MNSLGKRSTLSVALVALSALVLTACSSAPKPPVDSVTSLDTDEYGRTIKTTTIREVQPNLNPPPPIPVSPSQDKTTQIDIDSDGTDGDNISAHVGGGSGGQVQVNTPGDYETANERVHVRAPLVKVDTDGDSGSVHIKAPFININKNGRGDRTTIRIPGITIRGD